MEISKGSMSMLMIYGIPLRLFPSGYGCSSMPGLVWNPGWPQENGSVGAGFCRRMGAWIRSSCPGSCAPLGNDPIYAAGKMHTGITQIMGLATCLIHQRLALRGKPCAFGEYCALGRMSTRAGLRLPACVRAADTWLSAALDERFCAAAPLCSESTFAGSQR